jgi:8-oxo-dGTP diphosphatase
VLLVKRGEHPFRDFWALPGGFVGPSESSLEGARRELATETGIEQIWFEQLGTFDDPGRDPRTRVVSVAYLAILDEPGVAVAGDDAIDTRWVAVAQIVQGTLELAFDHADIVAAGVERAAAKLEYTTLATSLIKGPFTISDLRRVYEAVWGYPLHPSNFRRKVLGAHGFVEPTGRSVSVGRGRAVETFVGGRAGVLHPPIVRDHAGGLL